MDKAKEEKEKNNIECTVVMARCKALIQKKKELIEKGDLDTREMHELTGKINILLELLESAQPEQGEALRPIR